MNYEAAEAAKLADMLECSPRRCGQKCTSANATTWLDERAEKAMQAHLIATGMLGKNATRAAIVAAFDDIAKRAYLMAECMLKEKLRIEKLPEA